MHLNTATNCRSHYTYGNPGEVLTCERPLERHGTTLRGELIHMSRYLGVIWTWKDSEADK